MSERSSIFDMIGPIMIGPSSSHTAGVVKIGNTARKILGETPESAEIIFYNSFARTYEGHGSDRAILAGLLGFLPDDARIKEAFDHAEKSGMQFVFRSVGNASTLHPNSVLLKLKRGDRHVEVLGESLGGGVINIREVDGFIANITGQTYTLIIKAEDRKGTIAFIAEVLSHDDCNIATMTVSRKGKNDVACQFIEIDSPLSDLTVSYLKSLKWVKEIVYLTPSLG
ncbi:MAG TPA: L-serine ammonia-lyase, iron-sulfur-dependent subunit beta [Catalimonadaceae bacterium]|nr:L-serine ammonia-lyase, iron-sulfur-dependent subunit beta [Catalimonadaceae bacterium]